MGITLSEISWSHKDKHRVIPRIGGPRGVESAEAESRVVIPGRAEAVGSEGAVSRECQKFWSWWWRRLHDAVNVFNAMA